MRFDDVLKALNTHKGDGSWHKLARLAGVHYDTIARVARKDMENPSVQTVEKIADALAELFPETYGATPQEQKAA